MSLATLAEVCHLLDSISVPHWLLGDDVTGRAVVVPAGGRVLALAPAGSDENVLWLNPALARCQNAADFAGLGGSGAGGLRHWQAPESAYMWEGSPDPATFSNYKVQPAMDPGDYSVEQTSAGRCVLAA